MNSKIMLLSAIAATLFISSCKKDQLDSAFITISSPTKDQVIQNSDSIKVIAQIEPRNTAVINTVISLKDKKGRVLALINKGCACAGQAVLKINESFAKPDSKSEDIVLEICADLHSGDKICETVPFVLK